MKLYFVTFFYYDEGQNRQVYIHPKLFFSKKTASDFAKNVIDKYEFKFSKITSIITEAETKTNSDITQVDMDNIDIYTPWGITPEKQ